MVSTHAWKAPVSSPLPSTTGGGGGGATQQSQSPFLRSPFGSNAGGSAGAAGGMGRYGYGAPSSSSTAGGSSTRPFIGGGSDPKPPPTTDAGGGGATHDFESLLANSASLLSSMGRGGGGGGGAGTIGGASAASASAFGSAAAVPTSAPAAAALGDRSLLELDVASRAAFPDDAGAPARAAAATTYEAEASAHRLFAREGRGFDSARLGRRMRELERRAGVSAAAGGGGGGFDGMEEEEKKEGTPTDYRDGGGPGAAGGIGAGGGREGHPLADLSGASLEQILASHHEYCVRTALRQARERTTSQARRRAEARLSSDWEAERREILGRGVMGNRFLAGTGGGGGGGEIGGGVGVEGGIASRVPLLEGDSVATAGGGGASSSSSPYADIVPSPQILPANAEGLIKSHLAAVDQHLTAPSPPSQTVSDAATKLISSLQEGIKDAASDVRSGLTPEGASGYSNALSLLRSVINCNASLGIRPSSSPDDASVAAGVMGACDFFARQFASHAREAVRDAELSGLHPTSAANNRLASNTARDACAFASISEGRDVVEGPGGIWPKLYYCLRCGDLVAAQSVLQLFGNASGGDDADRVDPSVFNLVSQLAQLQQGQDNIFGDSTNGNARPAQRLANSLLSPTQAVIAARRSVADLYERTKTRARSSGGGGAAGDPRLAHRSACLAMLGGAESISEASALESSGIVRTVEDYLYGSLWHAIHLAEGAPSVVGGAGAIGGGGGLRRASEAVARLGVLVDRWGPSHFEREDGANVG